jgi:malonate-semialdehyde dehydrogenase (acetylating)/methylmalonate-semialdehyde dehydrogenase
MSALHLASPTHIAAAGHFIDGHPVDSGGTHEADVFDPATGLVRRRVAMGGAPEVERAVRSAATAFEAWSEVPAVRRAAVMFRFREILGRERDRLAHIVTSEHGKTLDDARAEIDRGIDVVDFACGAPHLTKGEFSEQVARDIDSFSMRQPLGVCAGISPFNFPAMVPMWMFPIALTCGNTFVLKPSEKDPSLSLELAQLLMEAGLPAGAFNVVNGGKAAAEALLDHPLVKAVSFVGSTPIAQAIYARGTASGKRVQALGGAKNHAIVLPDADLDQAVNGLMGAAFGSAGERCMAISIVVAVGAIGDELTARLTERARALRVGPGTADVDMGPLVTSEHRERVAGYIAEGAAEGARLVLDGRSHPAARSAGFFLGPTIFDDVTPDMRIYREEIFGPVLGIVRASTAAQALAITNGHPLANGAAIFTRSGDAARWFTHHADAGMIGVNVAIPVPSAFHSFGGAKLSLFGDHHVYGSEGVRFYTRLKTATVRWPADAGAAEFSMPTTR